MENKFMNEEQKEIVETERLFVTIKKMSPSTLVGVGLIILFFIFCFIVDLAIRWWIMVPIAAISVYLLYNNQKKTVGLERKFCIYGIWIIISLFILRDIVMSYKMASLIDSFRATAKDFQNIFKY
jgi:hypothetical protein